MGILDKYSLIVKGTELINSTYYKVIFITGNARYRSCSSTFTIYWVDEILLFEKAAYLYSHTGRYKSLYIELPKHKITYLFHNFAAVGEDWNR